MNFNPGAMTHSFPSCALFFEKRLRSVTANTRQDGHAWLALASGRRLVPEVTVYPLEEAVTALSDLKNDRLKGVAVLRVN